MSLKSDVGERRRHTGERNLRLALLLAVVVTAAGAGAFWWSLRDAPPTNSDLPSTWFDRPATQDPAGWRMVGAEPLVRLNLDGAAARVAVIAEDRTDIAVIADDPSAFVIEQGPAAVTITGGRSASGCAAAGPNTPKVTIRAPKGLQIRSSGAIAGTVVGADRLILDQTGCAAWRVDQGGELWLAQSGRGRIDVAEARRVRARVEGRGEIAIQAATEGLDGAVRGPGSIEAGTVGLQLDASVRGRGRIEVRSGFVGRARAFVQGRGLIRDRGVVGGLTAHARMGGVIQAAEVRGAAVGAGDVQFGRAAHPLTF